MDRKKQSFEKPVQRSNMRAKLGMAYYGLLRRILWVKINRIFARETGAQLAYKHFFHQTPLLRKLKDVDMQYQYNKIVNLKIAAKKLNGIIIHPGEVFSYWKLIGRPTRQKGYIEGMVLKNGTFGPGIGGGLCQMSNLIYWMAIHTPLTIVERHRHGYDVFPDSNRTQPFGSGATCFYPHGDLMIRNDTQDDFQLIINVGQEYLEGEFRASAPAEYHYEVIERNHEMRSEFWGGYSRHNELYRQIYDLEGSFVSEEFITANAALMMYSPFLTEVSAGSVSTKIQP